MGGGRISSSARPGNFLDFLRTSRKFPGNTVILPSPYRKRFPPWAYAKLPYRAWENCSGQCKGLFRAQKRKITMTSKENINFCHSALLTLLPHLLITMYSRVSLSHPCAHPPDHSVQQGESLSPMCSPSWSQCTAEWVSLTHVLILLIKVYSRESLSHPCAHPPDHNVQHLPVCSPSSLTSWSQCTSTGSLYHLCSQPPYLPTS